MFFKIGSLVENFGIIATVVGYHEKTKSIILEAAEVGRWLADPSKCREVEK